jgi:hypothetical protein
VLVLGKQSVPDWLVLREHMILTCLDRDGEEGMMGDLAFPHIWATVERTADRNVLVFSSVCPPVCTVHAIIDCSRTLRAGSIATIGSSATTFNTYMHWKIEQELRMRITPNPNPTCSQDVSQKCYIRCKKVAYVV